MEKHCVYVFQWETGEWAILRKRLMMPFMLAQQHLLSPKLWVPLNTLRADDQSHIVQIHFKTRIEYQHEKCNAGLFGPLCHHDIDSLLASGPVEARGAADSSCWPGGRKSNAGAVRQNGGRQHQNEALDGGDLCAFNRQRQAVVQVEVTSFSPSSPSLLLTVAKVKWCGLEQAMDHKGLHFAACLTFFASSIPYHTN